ncbi:MAG TPA: hypothetical protein VK957_12225 [Lunatimonas sp.]|nr:hypothetical protein [Lunatimonas sp.]
MNYAKILGSKASEILVGRINSIEISSGNDKIEVKHIDRKALKEIIQAKREHLQFQPLDLEAIQNSETSNEINKYRIKSESNLGYNVLKHSGIVTRPER